MSVDVLDRLLITLAVRLHASSVCRIERGWRLLFAPFEAITFHHVLYGSGSVRVGTSAWLTFGPGSLIVIPPRLPHAIGEAGGHAAEARGEEHCTIQHEGLVSFIAGDGSADVLLTCGMIAPTYEGALGLFAALRAPLVQDLSANASALQAFALMRDEITRPAVGTQALVETAMKQCLVLLLRQHLSGDAAASPILVSLQDQRLARAIVEVIERPAARHSVESLAQAAGMSRAAFAERFSQTLGQTPIDFVQKVRLRIAARLLATTDLPVKVVAMSIGYKSRSYFSRAFRAMYGVEPTRYRGGGGEEGELVRYKGAPPPHMFAS